MGGRVGGFYTEEIRSGGVREGFRLVTLDGRQATMAHLNIRSPYRVSKYGVDVDSLERVGVPALYRAAQQGNLVVIDEIGKMELFSASFREAISQIIGSGKRVLGTIMLQSHPRADRVKQDRRVHLIEVTRDNRHQVLEELRDWLGAAEDAAKIEGGGG